MSEHRLERLPVAAGIGVVVVAVIGFDNAPDRGRAAILLFLAALPFVAFAFGWRAPRLLLVAVVAPAGLFAFDGGGVLAAALPAMALVLAVPMLPRRTGVGAAALVAAVYVAVAVGRRELEWVAVAGGMAAAWSAGMSFGQLIDRLRELHVAQSVAADDAVKAERRRLAREVHDLVAHALTGTMLCLTEIRLLLDNDRDSVLRALDQAEGLARASLSDLRGTVRLLSEDGDPRLEPPIELDSDLTRLIEGYCRSGVVVRFTMTGTPAALSVASAWSVYRIVQESLTNAARHAPGAEIDVAMAWGLDGVQVSISNGSSSSLRSAAVTADSNGRGILGMSERAVLLGGWLEAGPTSAGWTVAAWIPVAPRQTIEIR